MYLPLEVGVHAYGSDISLVSTATVLVSKRACELNIPLNSLC